MKFCPQPLAISHNVYWDSGVAQTPTYYGLDRERRPLARACFCTGILDLPVVQLAFFFLSIALGFLLSVKIAFEEYRCRFWMYVDHRWTINLYLLMQFYRAPLHLWQHWSFMFAMKNAKRKYFFGTKDTVPRHLSISLVIGAGQTSNDFIWILSHNKIDTNRI